MLCTLVYTLLWALRYIATGEVGENDTVSTLFMGQFTLWTLPCYVASIIGAATMAGLVVTSWLASQRHGFIPTRTMMPLVIGLTLTASIDCLHYFDHRHIALILVFIAIDQIVSMYDYKRHTKAAFNVALLLLVATLFEPIMVWLLMFAIVGMVVYGVGSKRTIISFVIGITLMIYLTIGTLWLMDMTDVLTPLCQQMVNFQIITPQQWRWTDIGLAAITILLWIITIVYHATHRGNHNLNVHINFTFLCWGIGITLSLMIFAAVQITHIACIPLLLLTLIGSHYFTTHQTNSSNIIFIVFTLALVSYRILWVLGY